MAATRENMIEAIQTMGDCTRDQAQRVAEYYLADWTVPHGAFLDRDVIQRAILVAV